MQEVCKKITVKEFPDQFIYLLTSHQAPSSVHKEVNETDPLHLLCGFCASLMLHPPSDLGV